MKTPVRYLADRLEAWPFPAVRNYATNEAVTRLFLLFARAPDLTLVEKQYARLVVRCSYGRLSIWNRNAYYAWASDGTFTSTADEEYAWRNEMPSRYAVLCMRERLGATVEAKVSFQFPAIPELSKAEADALIDRISKSTSSAK